MKWKIPPRIKVYEALGAIADNRVQVKGNEADVVSSSRNKKYRVVYQPKNKTITSNDNGSYWQGYLGYPAIALLMKKGLLRYDKDIAELFKDIAWKDLNTKFKDDYAKTEIHIEKQLGEESWANAQELAINILAQIKQLKLQRPSSQTKPPQGY